MNKNNTIDVGMMQINSIHFKALANYGISENLLRENRCANVFSGTWLLKKSIQHYGYTWDGIGNYHSRTPVYHDRYVKNIISLISHQTTIINNISVIDQIDFHKYFSCDKLPLSRSGKK